MDQHPARALATSGDADTGGALAGHDVDVIIAGGGVAGVMAAIRLARLRPDLRLLLIERERELGGRLRGGQGATYGYGLGGMTPKLAAELRGLDCAAVDCRDDRLLGVLAGGRLTSVPIGEWFQKPGARLLGGAAAAREWDVVQDVLAPQAEAGTGLALSAVWKATRKAPSAVVMEHFARAVGIPDLWSAAQDSLSTRARLAAAQARVPHLSRQLQELVAEAGPRLELRLGDLIVAAHREGDHYLVHSESGRYRARALIVAQPPWLATGWLRRAEWPTPLLQLASKTRPVSLVTLSERAQDTPEAAAAMAALPDVTLVPAEDVQVIRSAPDELVFQATIDFELSLQAPAVAKAVKALRRAKRKFDQLFPDVLVDQGHIALVPVAWAQSPAQADRRHIARLESQNLQSGTLAFCGDAYGPTFDGDANTMASVTAASEAIAHGLSAAVTEEGL